MARSRLIGEAALQRRLEAIKEPKVGMWELQKRAVKEAKDRVPRKTGNLGRSIVPGMFSGSSAVIEVRSSYAAFVEYPTRPHIIRAKPGKVLAWPATAAGRRLSGRANARALSGSLGLGGAGGGFGGITIKRVGKDGKASGTFRYARSVKHPGTKAQPFLIPGAVAALNSIGIEAIIIKPWNEAA